MVIALLACEGALQVRDGRPSPEFGSPALAVQSALSAPSSVNRASSQTPTVSGGASRDRLVPSGAARIWVLMLHADATLAGGDDAGDTLDGGGGAGDTVAPDCGRLDSPQPMKRAAVPEGGASSLVR